MIRDDGSRDCLPIGAGGQTSEATDRAPEGDDDRGANDASSVFQIFGKETEGTAFFSF